MTDALALAADGYRVFPLVYGDKRPATPNGFKDAVSEPDDVARLFGKARRNIGIATGYGLTVVDVDEYKGGALPDGLPPTRVIRTGSGGTQHYYRTPIDAGIRDSVAKVAPAVDIRSDGGYVVGPGSHLFAANSKVGRDGDYVVEDDEPIADMPPEWIERCKAAVASGFVPLTDDALPQAGEGRNDYLASYAGRQANNHTAAEVRALVRVENQRFAEPLSEDELERTIDKSTDRWAQPRTGGVITHGTPREPRATITIPDYPFDALPDSLSALALRASASTGTSAVGIATHGLAVIAAACGTSAEAQIGEWRVRPMLWTAVIADPGAAKSTMLRIATRPLVNRDDVAMTAYDELGDVTKPRPRQHVARDVTVESLGILLSQNRRGMLLVADELVAIVSGMNQYKGGKGNDRQAYLSLWDGAPLVVNRVKRDMIHVSRPMLSVTGGLQPSVVDSLRGEDGMSGRWLVAYLDDFRRSHPTDASYAREASEWTATIDDLVARETPLTLTLVGDAYTEYRRLANEYIDRASEEDDYAVKAFDAKMETYLARISVILHVATEPYDNGSGSEVQSVRVETVRNAARVLEYYAAGAAARLRADWSLTSAPWEEEKYRKVIAGFQRYIALHPEADWRDIQNGHTAGIKTAADFRYAKARYQALGLPEPGV